MEHSLKNRMIPVGAGLDALVMQPNIDRQLREIIARWNTRTLVRKQWGLGGRVHGEGLHCYFSGPSGTGKAAASGLIAQAVGVPLYRVNLAGIVSNDIGESEKRLIEILDAAGSEGAALLFDGTDALLPEHSDPTNGAERTDNPQFAALLDRIERYNGLTFLTSNLCHSMAFRRRFHVCVEFVLPDRAARERIWKLSLARAPVADDVDFDRLAHTELSGGFIQKAAFNAASRAAIQSGLIEMRLLEEELTALG